MTEVPATGFVNETSYQATSDQFNSDQGILHDNGFLQLKNTKADAKPFLRLKIKLKNWSVKKIASKKYWFLRWSLYSIFVEHARLRLPYFKGLSRINYRWSPNLLKRGPSLQEQSGQHSDTKCWRYKWKFAACSPGQKTKIRGEIHFVHQSEDWYSSLVQTLVLKRNAIY